MSAALTVYAYTNDLDRVRALYESALGVSPADHGQWRPFDLAGGVFALHGVANRPDADPRAYHLSFQVDDIDAALARFESAGARVLRGVADEAFGKRALVADPDGRQIELTQQDA